MKKIIHFSKAFVPLVILSSVIIIGGLVTVFTRGINYGIDFKAGLIEEVAIAPPALSVTYTGPAIVSAHVSGYALTLVVSGIGADNTTHVYSYAQYPTVGDIAAVLNTVAGVQAKVVASDSVLSEGLFANTAASSVLSTVPLSFHYTPENAAIPVDEVRTALVAAIPEASVKAVGTSEQRRYQIRVGDDGTDSEASGKITESIISALGTKFGSQNIAVIQTDFIGARFSASLARSSVILTVLTLLLILLYCSFRFKWDFALGAVLAIVHDALIMVAFISFTQMEFSSITIAAILTIVGYSINDTIVVLDRVRENTSNPNIKVKLFTEILDISQTEILSRTIITTVTTMLAVISLYVFTTGSMKDFALALLVGMVSGVYSTIFITSAFVAFTRRNWKPSDEEKHAGGTLKITV